MAPVLSVTNLTVDYDGMRALDNLTTELKGGNVTGLIGPNGAGKTSFIKALCGRVRSNGSITINNQRLKLGADRQKFIGLVPQDIGLYPFLTARENLDVFARIQGIKRQSRSHVIDTALKAVGMQNKADETISKLSGGMKRRVNVAAAIMHDPALIILDEPTAGIDVPARDTVHNLARSLADEGKAVLLVTHELDQAEALCDQILLLAKGKQLALSSPADILSFAYGNAREVMVRFSHPPNPETMAALQPFAFMQSELPTIWTAMTEASEVSFVSAFMASLNNGDDYIREISVRRPGLTSLMHVIEKTGKLPC